MKKIPLSQNRECKNKYLKLFAIVDNEDYERINKFNWSVDIRKNTSYAYRKEGGKSIRMQNDVLWTKPKNKIVDHKDRDGLNNKKSNLRICNYVQNGANRSLNKNKSSKYLGVCYIKRVVKYNSKRGGVTEYDFSGWCAFIKSGTVRLNLGRFKTEKEAAIAYNNAAKKCFGEFANLNKV